MKQSSENKPGFFKNLDPHNAVQLSRRQFLKVAGNTFLGSVISALPFIPPIASIDSQSGGYPDVIETSLDIAKNNPMFQEAVSELLANGFEFDVTPSVITQYSLQGNSTGVVLQQRRTEETREGADLVLTVDMTDQALNFVQVITGWCLVDFLRVASVIFDARRATYEETRSPLMRVGLGRAYSADIPFRFRLCGIRIPISADKWNASGTPGRENGIR
jgi:hypothetical protein